MICPVALKPADGAAAPKPRKATAISANRALKPVPNRQSTAAAAAREAAEGHGRRLTAAFEALEAFPALAESRNRVLRLVREEHRDRKSTRLNSSHSQISYAVFCLK